MLLQGIQDDSYYSTISDSVYIEKLFEAEPLSWYYITMYKALWQPIYMLTIRQQVHVPEVTHHDATISKLLNSNEIKNIFWN